MYVYVCMRVCMYVCMVHSVQPDDSISHPEIAGHEHVENGSIANAPFSQLCPGECAHVFICSPFLSLLFSFSSSVFLSLPSLFLSLFLYKLQTTNYKLQMFLAPSTGRLQTCRLVHSANMGSPASIHCKLCVWVYGCMGLWVYGCMGVWVCGCMGVWEYETSFV
jgi:hypothetical protein